MPVLPPSFRTSLRAGPSQTAVEALIGAGTTRPRLERVHFSDRRPVLLQYAAGQTTLLAEWVPKAGDRHAAETIRRLKKPRHGQAGARPEKVSSPISISPCAFRGWMSGFPVCGCFTRPVPRAN
ncbi:MAG: hypothetical protein R3D84_09880 [Paracoccaceae bacterium]